MTQGHVAFEGEVYMGGSSCQFLNGKWRNWCNVAECSFKLQVVDSGHVAEEPLVWMLQ